MYTLLKVTLFALVSTVTSTGSVWRQVLPLAPYLACDTETQVEIELAKDKWSLEHYSRPFEYGVFDYNLVEGFDYARLPPAPTTKGCELEVIRGLVTETLDSIEVHVESELIYRLKAVDVITPDVTRPGLIVHKKVLLRERIFAWDL
jgi:hypothetical protein